MKRRLATAVTVVALAAGWAWGADEAGPAAGRMSLPQAQEYQRVLRAHMATLTEKDFEHGVTNHLTVPPENPDPEYRYRTHIMAMIQQPHVGGKRGIPAVNAPAHNFLLATMEGANAIIVPPVWAEALGTFIRWDSPGNPFRDSRALKLRAFVTAAAKLMLVDDHLDNPANAGAIRSDWNGYNLISAAAPYPVFRDELPAEVRKAYEAGLLRLGRKLLAMGPKGEECDYELSAAVGLWYAAQAVGDADFAREAEAYARTLCADPRFFDPAGYWVEAGGLDLGFGGMANFWAVWLALASDWPFARDAVDRAYRLRAHLVLPEPDGTLTGPSAFNNRLGSPASEDQWHWDGTRDHGAAMLTDEALCLIAPPTAEQLADAMAQRVDIFNGQLYGNLRNHPYTHPTGERYLGGDAKTGRYLENHEIRGTRWSWRMFPNGFNYPIGMNPAYEFYRPGAHARLAELQAENSPLLRSPYLRNETFIRTLGTAFVAARQEGYAAIVHVGPVGSPAPGSGMAQYTGPMGFGGGQLAAFWTPAAGSAILARRSGLAMRGPDCLLFDRLDQWPLWPIHAVSGRTSDGQILSSGRIVAPAVTHTSSKGAAGVRVAGELPVVSTNGIGQLTGRLDYARTFTIGPRGVRVETTIRSDGKAGLAELIETIPVYLDGGKPAAGQAPPTIEFRVGRKWIPAESTPADKVSAVRVTRYAGAIEIAFDKPQRVKLSDAVWQDTYLTRARCRNVTIDLLAGGALAASPAKGVTIAYSISPASR